MGRYTGIPERLTPEGKRYRRTVKYPDLPLTFSDIYVYMNDVFSWGHELILHCTVPGIWHLVFMSHR